MIYNGIRQVAATSTPSIVSDAEPFDQVLIGFVPSTTGRFWLSLTSAAAPGSADQVPLFPGTQTQPMPIPKNTRVFVSYDDAGTSPQTIRFFMTDIESSHDPAIKQAIEEYAAELGLYGALVDVYDEVKALDYSDETQALDDRYERSHPAPGPHQEAP